GVYTVRMSYGPEEADRVGQTFEVQEFVAPRHFAEVSFSRFQRRDESMVNRPFDQAFLKIRMSSSYYAGGPLKHGQVRWKIYYAQSEQKVKGFDEFQFGYRVEDEFEVIESGESILDEKGELSVEFPLDNQILTGRFGLTVVATAVDFDGRAASARSTFQADPEYKIGLSRHPEKVKAGEPLELSAVVLDKDGQALNEGVLEVQVLEKSGYYVRKRDPQGNLYWDYESLWRKSQTAEAVLKDGRAQYRFEFPWGGRHVLAFNFRDAQGRVFSSATSYEVSGDIYWDDYQEREKPYEALNLSANKEAYRPGETAKVVSLARRPMTTYLVTLERDGLLEYKVFPGGSIRGEFPLEIKAGFSPNVYVSVLGLSGRGDFPVYAGRFDAEAPNFTFGALNLPVRAETEKLQVQIGPLGAKLKGRPGQEVNLEVAVKDHQGRGLVAEMALAVVDERVLALTAYKTPTLDTLTRFDLPLAVFTGDLRAILMHQTPFKLVRKETMTGGGGF
ncbi:MAG: hypothetical protein AB1896_22805, partial [Thermodesulfobacteriota bacterium]